MDLETFFKIADHFGLPVALLLGLLGILGICARVVWRFLAPRIALWFDKHFALIDSISAKTQAIDKIEASGESCMAGHELTHKKLEEVHLDVRKLFPPFGSKSPAPS